MKVCIVIALTCGFAGSAAAQSAEHEVAELRFERQKIHFGDEYERLGGGRLAELHRGWVAYQGDVDQRLEPEEFYALVGHPELGDEYEHRERLAAYGFLVATGGFLGAVAMVIEMARVHPDMSGCSIQLTPAQHNACFEASEQQAADDRSAYVLPMALFTGVMVGAGIYGGWYRLHPHPIGEGEAKSLAQAYNDNLRRELGLPTASRAPRVHDLRLAPVVTGNTGGLVLAGRF